MKVGISGALWLLRMESVSVPCSGSLLHPALSGGAGPPALDGAQVCLWLTICLSGLVAEQPWGDSSPGLFHCRPLGSHLCCTHLYKLPAIVDELVKMPHRFDCVQPTLC